MSTTRTPYSASNPYSRDLVPGWDGLCRLWRSIGAHQATYGAPPEYRKTASFLASGGFMTAATRRAP